MLLLGVDRQIFTLYKFYDQFANFVSLLIFFICPVPNPLSSLLRVFYKTKHLSLCDADGAILQSNR